MAAHKGNNYYLKRSSIGRKKIFETPDILWDAACEYFEHVDNNPWIKNDVVKGGESVGQSLQIPIPRPYTLTGLSVFLGVHSETLRNYARDEKYKVFFEVFNQIESIIYSQKFEGATVGVFNGNIIARDLGLTDKQEVKHKEPLKIEVTTPDKSNIKVDEG